MRLKNLVVVTSTLLFITASQSYAFPGKEENDRGLKMPKLAKRIVTGSMLYLIATANKVEGYSHNHQLNNNLLQLRQLDSGVELTDLHDHGLQNGLTNTRSNNLINPDHTEYSEKINHFAKYIAEHQVIIDEVSDNPKKFFNPDQQPGLFNRFKKWVSGEKSDQEKAEIYRLHRMLEKPEAPNASQQLKSFSDFWKGVEIDQYKDSLQAQKVRQQRQEKSLLDGVKDYLTYAQDWLYWIDSQIQIGPRGVLGISVGIESEIKLYPCDNEDELFGFENGLNKETKVKREIDFDIIDDTTKNGEPMSQVYEFRTIGGVETKNQIITTISECKNWLEPIFQSFKQKENNLYFDVQHAGKTYELCLPKKYSVNGKYLASYNQLTFAYPMSDVLILINNLMLKNTDVNFMTINDKVKKQLFFLKPNICIDDLKKISEKSNDGYINWSNSVLNSMIVHYQNKRLY